MFSRRAFSLQRACGLPTTPTPLAICADATRLRMLELRAGTGRQVI